MPRPTFLFWISRRSSWVASCRSAWQIFLSHLLSSNV